MGYELAMEHKYSVKHSGKVGLYYQSVDDYIQFQHVYPYYSYNINHVNLWGLELEHRWQMDKKNALTFIYTYQKTEKIRSNPSMTTRGSPISWIIIRSIKSA